MVRRRALVTGATGGLGQALVPQLLEAGYDVTATGRSVAVGARLEDMGARFVQADLCHADLGSAFAGIDVVFHLAALSSPWGRPQDFEAINIRATQRLLAAARTAGCGSFIYASTPSIYVEARDRLGITEASPHAQRFANAYARTKHIAEEAVLRANAPGFATIALRPRALIGPNDTVLLPRLRRAIRTGVMPLPNGGNALIEVTDVRDAARAFLAADAAAARLGGQAFNITGGAPRRLRELLETIFAALGTAPRPVSVPADLAIAAARVAEGIAAMLPGRPEPPVTAYTIMTLGYSQTFDLTAARQHLRWAPRYSPEAAVMAALGGTPDA